MSRYDPKADFKVHDMKTMGKQRDREAMELLKRISHQVQPIMRRREWRVPLLSEFFPANPNLLGLNIGGGGGRTREIKVRLRPARDPDSFLPYESVLNTMLHELVHNVRGPHDSAFYKLLDEITAECEELMAKGVGGTGVGFDGPSNGRLGSHSFIPAHNPPAGRLRDHALKAAEERAKRQRIMPTGPRRLGGADGGGPSSLSYATPAAAAAAAAERRCRDNRWCPCERLAGALNKALAAAAGAETADVSSGAAGRGGARGVSGGCSAAAEGVSTAGTAAKPGSVPPGSRRLSAAEVEADLVRQIEEGVIDLTLDSDSGTESDSGLDTRGNGRGCPGHPAGGQGGGGEGGTTVGVDRRWSGNGNDTAVSGAPRGGSAPVTISAAAAVAVAVAVKRERAGGGSAAAVTGRPAAATGGVVGGVERTSGDGGDGHASARPAAGLGAALSGSSGTSATAVAAAVPLAPSGLQPPLQGLHPRNAAAAAAAAAALARMQAAAPPPMANVRQQRRQDAKPPVRPNGSVGPGGGSGGSGTLGSAAPGWPAVGPGTLGSELGGDGGRGGAGSFERGGADNVIDLTDE